MFGFLKKVMPGARERSLSPHEARAANVWRDKSMGEHFDVSQEVMDLTDRQVVMLHFVTQYAVKERGRLLMPMERFGVIGFMTGDVETAMGKLEPSDFAKMRETMIKVYTPMASRDGSGDMRGLFFDLKFKYDF